MSNVHMSAAFAFVTLASVGCGVRVGSMGDLVGSVEQTPHADAGIAAPGSDGTKRLTSYTCGTPPPSTAPSQRVAVPAGAFTMGCGDGDDECKPDELPPHAVTLGDYEIDVTEVSQAQYYACVAAGACLAPTCDWDPCGARADYPVVCVDHADALAYCAWRGAHLPTEAEWEKAARGTDGRKFPWGHEGPDCARTNMIGCAAGADGKDGTAPVGRCPSGASPYGALDMAGNVVEWVADQYGADYYATSPSADPTGPTTATKYVGRGGGWRSTPFWHRTSTRDDYEPDYFKSSEGLRCAK